MVSLVGYTNAGKSSLLNALTASTVFTEDRLFATLDPTTRSLRLPGGREVVVTDTVGFIRDLPGDLVSAFRATLEELDDADLLLHVVDAASPAAVQQHATVERTLAELGLADTQQLVLLNKCDAAEPDDLAALQRQLGGVILSARTGEGLERLVERVERKLAGPDRLPPDPDPNDPPQEDDHAEEDRRRSLEAGHHAPRAGSLPR